MVSRFTGLAAFQALALAGTAHIGVAYAAGKIGVTAATQNDVTGTSAGASEKLAAGSQLFQDEVINTGAKSTAQLLFLDETSLSVGPQSQVTLDKFIYNPKTGAGDVVLSATRGAFRFITGSQDPTNYKLRTAVATIGVRGTIVDCYKTDRGLYVSAQEGKVLVEIDGVTYTLLPGQTLFIDAKKNVSGPFTPDGEFFRVAGIVPFPLFGSILPGEHEQFEVPDDATVRADELFPHPDDCDYGESGNDNEGGA